MQTDPELRSLFKSAHEFVKTPVSLLAEHVTSAGSGFVITSYASNDTVLFGAYKLGLLIIVGIETLVPVGTCLIITSCLLVLL